MITYLLRSSSKESFISDRHWLRFNRVDRMYQKKNPQYSGWRKFRHWSKTDRHDTAESRYLSQTRLTISRTVPQSTRVTSWYRESTLVSWAITDGFVSLSSYYRGAHKSLARPTSRCILFDGENISYDASLVINSTNVAPIMIINRIYEQIGRASCRERV